jgi:hypothetical protein
MDEVMAMMPVMPKPAVVAMVAMMVVIMLPNAAMDVADRFVPFLASRLVNVMGSRGELRRHRGFRGLWAPDCQEHAKGDSREPEQHDSSPRN